MKVLQVVPFFTPVRGGSVIVPYYLSEELSKRGYEVTIITTDFEFDEEYAKTIQKEGVKVRAFKCVANIGLFLISPSMKKWLEKEIKKFDVVHLHNFRSYQNIITHYYAKKYGIPYVMQAHGSVPRIVEKKVLKMLFDHTYGYRILKEASKLIAISKAEVENYKKISAENSLIELVYNGIDTNTFKTLPPLGFFKNKYSIFNKYILFLGRIDKTKGLDFLVKGFSQLLKEIDYRVSLVIVGPKCNFKNELSNMVRELDLERQVKFIDFLQGKEKLSAYHDADVFVSPASYKSGVLLTPLEAIMCNTPVIVTSEIGEILEAADSGYTTKYGDVSELTQKMKTVLEHPEEAKQSVEKAQKYILDNLTWDIVANKMETIYQDCVHHV